MYKRADAALDLGKCQLAIDLSKKILAHSPNDYEAYSTIAKAYIDLKKYDKAETFIKKSLALCPNSETPLAIYCNILMLKKDYNGAIKLSDEVLMKNHKNELALYCRTFSLYKLKEYKRAEELTTYLLSIRPNAELYHCTLANIYSETDRFDLAEKEYLEALKLNPNDGYTLNNYAVAILDNNIKDGEKKALDLLQNSLRINPNDEVVISNYQTCQDRINNSLKTMLEIKTEVEEEFKKGKTYLFLFIYLLLFISSPKVILIFLFLYGPYIILYVWSIIYLKYKTKNDRKFIKDR